MELVSVIMSSSFLLTFLDFEAMVRKEHSDSKRGSGVHGSVAAWTMFRS